MIEQIKQGLEAELQSLGSRTEARLGENFHDETGKLYFLGGKMAAFEKVEPWLRYLIGQVEEMQKTLEWYADHRNHPPLWLHDGGEMARKTLQSLKEDKPNGNSTTV